MKAIPITNDIFMLHADMVTTDLFEGIWPIPEGVSLNSYLVKGDRIALVDLVRDWCDAPARFGEELAQAGVAFPDIDYLVLNHMEPDHTGWLGQFRELNPRAEILATAKAVELIRNFYGITDGVRAVKSGELLDLGGGKVLRFEETPNVHWPETMMSFETGSGVLFSCDAFGSYGKLGERVFDDEYSADEHAFFERESLRYYANIVASFSLFVKRAVQKLEALDIKVVAPSHGIVWRKDPRAIIDRYVKYAAYMDGPQEKEICVVWGSMYGNTERGLAAVLDGIDSEKVPHSIHRVPNEDASYVLADAYRSSGIVLAMPTYEYRMFPPMAYILDLFERKHVWNRKAFRLGSFGWVGGAKKEYEEKIAPLKWDCLEPAEWPGAPGDGTLSLLFERGRELARRVRKG
ncbi:MAG: FprA family A-type flavoprotein [Spirochaetes bacterium]|nr:FprA family A-type flavoprotein [Spirochaetota bacterium]